MKPEVAIVIVSYNVRDDLARCLDSLFQHPPATPHEIVVVDNASTDGSVAMVHDRWPSVQVIALPENRGFSAANNVGIRATAERASRLVLLLNSDTIIPEGAIDTLIDRFDAVPDVAVAGPKLVDGDGRPELSFGSMPGPFNEARQKRLGLAYARGEPSTIRRVEQLTSKEHFPDWVTGACMLVSRIDAEKAGLLDERYFMYLEDADFCASIRALGWRVLFTPAATIVHLRGRSRARVSNMVESAYRRSQLAFYRKHHPAWAPALRLYLAARRRLPR